MFNQLKPEIYFLPILKILALERLIKLKTKICNYLLRENNPFNEHYQRKNAVLIWVRYALLTTNRKNQQNM